MKIQAMLLKIISIKLKLKTLSNEGEHYIVKFLPLLFLNVATVAFNQFYTTEWSFSKIEKVMKYVSNLWSPFFPPDTRIFQT